MILDTRLRGLEAANAQADEKVETISTQMAAADAKPTTNVRNEMEFARTPEQHVIHIRANDMVANNAVVKGIEQLLQDMQLSADHVE